jgi:hypothetical protein
MESAGATEGMGAIRRRSDHFGFIALDMPCHALWASVSESGFRRSYNFCGIRDSRMQRLYLDRKLVKSYRSYLGPFFASKALHGQSIRPSRFYVGS